MADAASRGVNRALLGSIVVAVALSRSGAAFAQCEAGASSCVACHEAKGLRPVQAGPQAWHLDHAFADLCVACHGGDPQAQTADAAHAAMRAPLADPAAACGGCHGAELDARVARYATAAVSTVEVPTPPPAPPGAAQAAGHAADRALAAVAVALAIALYALARRGLAPASGRRTLRAWLVAPAWDPVVAGVGLGVVVAISVVAFGRPISASAAFDKLAAYVGHAWFAARPYYRYVMRPGITWQVWLMVGVLGGAFASSRLAGQARLRWLPDAQWTPRFGARRWRRLAIAFVGAMLVQIGAGIAGGCTSGLAISGGAVLAPAAFLFMAGMFAGGIPTAWLWHRGRRAP